MAVPYLGSKMALFTWRQVPAELREDFIFTGYRPLGTPISFSIRSALQLHNETFNVWTHLLPLVYFLYFIFVDVDSWLNYLKHSEEQLYPLYGYLFGICLLFCFSSVAHLCNCVSIQWRNVCFMLDYAAISFYGTCTAMAYYFYTRPRPMVWNCGGNVFLAASTLSSMFAAWACCWSRVVQTKAAYALRVSVFGLPYVVGSIPVFARLLNPEGHVNAHQLSNTSSNITRTLVDPETEQNFKFHYMCHVTLLIAGAIVNIIKFPERFFPGRFDIFGHSHQWFHILVFLSIREQFWLLIMDIKTDIHIKQLGELPEPSATTIWGVIAILIFVQAFLIVHSIFVLRGNGFNLTEEDLEMISKIQCCPASFRSMCSAANGRDNSNHYVNGNKNHHKKE